MTALLTRLRNAPSSPDLERLPGVGDRGECLFELQQTCWKLTRRLQVLRNKAPAGLSGLHDACKDRISTALSRAAVALSLLQRTTMLEC